MTNGARIIFAAALALALSACQTWDSMSGRQQGTATGAAVGGAAGAAVSGGLLAPAGAAVGGALLGGELGDQREEHQTPQSTR